MSGREEAEVEVEALLAAATDKLGAAMHGNLNEYKALLQAENHAKEHGSGEGGQDSKAERGDEGESEAEGTKPVVFFDLVILTACDEQQAASYRQVLAARRRQNTIPKTARYAVYADPQGPKVGNGGATMHALQQMRKEFGPVALTWKILLLHAGGYSKRLPNVSIIGKIFTSLPLGDPLYTALEVKLASYIHLPARMNPGVFVAAADAIELIVLDDNLHFTQRGFTALGHPSSLTIGTTHGVFVLEDGEREQAHRSPLFQQQQQQPSKPTPSHIHHPLCRVATCARFLHKPTVQRMHDMGAVIPYTNMVYTDSSFYFDMETANLLLKFYEDNSPLGCEIDGYGDFLQALGPKADSQYCSNTANVVAVEDTLTTMRLKLYHFLRDNDVQLHVALCNLSKFYHIGTQREYLYHLCEDPLFRQELGLSRIIASKAPADVVKDAEVAEACVMTSCLEAGVILGKHTVIESCHLPSGSRVGSRCLLSCCRFERRVDVPDNILLHTAALDDGSFITLFLGMDETLKDGALFEEVNQKLTLCGTPLSTALRRLLLSKADLWPEANDGDKVTFWSAQLFTPMPTVAGAARLALDMVAALQAQGPLPAAGSESPGRLSVADVLNAKSLHRCLSLCSPP